MLAAHARTWRLIELDARAYEAHARTWRLVELDARAYEARARTWRLVELDARRGRQHVAVGAGRVLDGVGGHAGAQQDLHAEAGGGGDGELQGRGAAHGVRWWAMDWLARVEGEDCAGSAGSPSGHVRRRRVGAVRARVRVIVPASMV